MTEENKEQELIANIKQMLDTNRLDVDTRAALQQARIHALAQTTKYQKPQRWLEFAFVASFLTILAINLPYFKTDAPLTGVSQIPKKPSLANNTKTHSDQHSVKPEQSLSSVATTQKNANQAQAIDMDLLENLDLYEDTEFYQWLSEQETQGDLDA
jgi:hypothetical protein